ncbi:hypothetical protein PPO43_13000 [Saprospira sp. CCB-QB6]|uniref:hypothetical protein n=1 Tax=Saprospira sp. CCB-QB6 TaxID=3023936 RepID=UPI00234953F4|nr:hypothetical protein [Saprospira sp. CCB-QB6]WCL80887.1 hypothetical protein PPO43_13000 [Saprospira sp. CCB-QB6]
MKRNYFICSVGDPEKSYDLENLNRCILKCCFVLHAANSQKGSITEIQNGDILILKFREHFIAYGRAISSLKTDTDLGEGWNHVIDVNLWIVGNHSHRYGIKDAQQGGNNYSTVKKVSKEFALSKMEEIGYPF